MRYFDIYFYRKISHILLMDVFVVNMSLLHIVILDGIKLVNDYPMFSQFVGNVT